MRKLNSVRGNRTAIIFRREKVMKKLLCLSVLITGVAKASEENKKFLVEANNQIEQSCISARNSMSSSFSLSHEQRVSISAYLAMIHETGRLHPKNLCGPLTCDKAQLKLDPTTGQACVPEADSSQSEG